MSKQSTFSKRFKDAAFEDQTWKPEICIAFGSGSVIRHITRSKSQRTKGRAVTVDFFCIKHKSWLTKIWIWLSMTIAFKQMALSFSLIIRQHQLRTKVEVQIWRLLLPKTRMTETGKRGGNVLHVSDQWKRTAAVGLGLWFSVQLSTVNGIYLSTRGKITTV